MVEYIRTDSIKIGDILAKPLYDDRGMILLKQGNRVTEIVLNAIKTQGYKGIYIQHAEGSQREAVKLPEPILSDLDTIQIIKDIKEMFDNKKIWNDAYDTEFITSRKKIEGFVDDLIKILKERNLKNQLLFEMEDNRGSKNWLYYHCLNTTMLTIGVCIKLGLSDDTIRNVAIGAMYHDLGKGKYPELIDKRDLTDEDRARLREHPESCFRILQKLQYPVQTTYAVWMSHEREDGSGYPNSLDSKQIPICAKVVGLASMYDNMVCPTPFNHHPLTQKEALEFLWGDQRFDVDCMKALNQIIVPYPIGTKIKLSNAEEGIVVKNHPGLPLTPTVIIKGKEIDMSKNENYRSVVIV